MIRWHDGGLELTLRALPPVWVHPSVPFVAAVLCMPLWLHGSTNGLITASLVVPAMILCVFAHEWGHAAMAKRWHLRPVLIRLLPMGGEAVMEGIPWQRRADVQITLAGPAVNLLLGAVCVGLHWLLTRQPAIPAGEPWSFPPPHAIPPPVRALAWAGWTNIALAGVNMLPAFPLDGGHVALVLIERRVGQRRATFLVGLSGVVLGSLARLIFLVSVLAGAPIWSPPSVRLNWAALRRGTLHRTVPSVAS